MQDGACARSHALLPALEEDEEDEERTTAPPFVTVPLSATEDAVVGTIDVEASARLGEPVNPACSPGPTAASCTSTSSTSRTRVVDCALHAVSARRCVVERTGVSASRPCRALCVATWNPDEGDVKRRIVDAFALHASADEPLAVERRVRGVELALGVDGRPAAVADEARGDEAAAAAAVAARNTLARVRVTDAQVGWLRFYPCRVILPRSPNLIRIRFVIGRLGGSWTSPFERGAWAQGGDRGGAGVQGVRGVARVGGGRRR